MNRVPCRDCVHFDPQPKFSRAGKPRHMWYAWCTAKSKYAATDPDGQTIPSEAARVDEAEVLSKPVLVRAADVHVTCTSVVRKAQDAKAKTKK